MSILEMIREWDVAILLYIQEFIRNDFLTPFMKVITYSGNQGIIWLLLCFGLLLNKKSRRVGFVMLLSLALSFLVNNLILKNVIARVRPYEAIPGLFRMIGKQVDWSFPSGHTASSFAAAGAILLASRKKYWGILALFYGTLIAFSRLYLGVHYPTDVLAGLISGFMMSLIIYGCIRSIEKERDRKRQEKDDMKALQA